jgi:preprotein translocase subunit SecY
MEELKSELAELREFVAELKADRAATKEKERRESWTKYVSMGVVIIAVISSIVAQQAGKFGGMAQMSQAQASDEWNYYQALSIKQHMFELSRGQLPKDATTPEAIAQQKKFDAKIADYEKRKADRQAAAQSLEAKRQYASRMGARMSLAGACFTVSIAVASICLVTKKKPLWAVSLILSGIGVLIWVGVAEKLLSK